MKIQDNRITARTLLVEIPNKTVFQGTINGFVTGTFRKNGNGHTGYVFSLVDDEMWQSGGCCVGGTQLFYCDNYQPVHGRIVIERNA